VGRLENQKQSFLRTSHLLSSIVRNIISAGVPQSCDVINVNDQATDFSAFIMKKEDITFTFQNIFKQGLFVKALDI